MLIIRWMLAAILVLILSTLVKTQSPTHEDELNLQIVLLRAQLAQSMSATAKCEAEGPQSAKAIQDAQTAAQALLKSLDERGLTIEQNKIVPKPAQEKPHPSKESK